MTENMKAFLEKVSQADDTVFRSLNQLDQAGITRLAADYGIMLTDVDFDAAHDEAEGEMDLEEGNMVAGGGKCYCVAGGGGKGGGRDFTCACVGAGAGNGKQIDHCLLVNREKGYEEGSRCVCMGYGQGSSYN